MGWCLSIRVYSRNGLQHRRNSWRKCWHVEGGLRVPNSGISCMMSYRRKGCNDPIFSGEADGATEEERYHAKALQRRSRSLQGVRLIREAGEACTDDRCRTLAPMRLWSGAEEPPATALVGGVPNDIARRVAPYLKIPGGQRTPAV
ncbi:unnamed protein product [Ascophyllum nodosum]